MIIRKEDIEYLNKKLDLPDSPVIQDWAIEMSNPERLREFIIAFQSNEFSESQKYAICALILASLEELLYMTTDYQQEWTEVKSILLSEKTLFNDLLNYYAMIDETEKNLMFKITPLIREIV